MKNEKRMNYIVHLLHLLSDSLIKKNLIQSNGKILVSISAGQDSIFLYILFLLLKRQWNLYFGLIWFNHFWQKDSFYNFFHLTKLQILWNNPFYILLAPYKIYTEKESRFWRQESSTRLSKFYNYDRISIAHTGSDRIETLFFQLIRGTGSSGIRSLAWAICQNVKYPAEIHISIFYSVSFFNIFLLQNRKTLKKNDDQQFKLFFIQKRIIQYNKVKFLSKEYFKIFLKNIKAHVKIVKINYVFNF